MEQPEKEIDWIGEIDGAAAKEILRKLSQDPGIKEKVDSLIENSMQYVDPDLIAFRLSDSLSDIDEEEVWARSGRDRYSTIDAAHEAIEDELREYVRRVERFRKLDMADAEHNMVAGILRGLMEFRDSEHPVLEGAPDIVDQMIKFQFDSWKKAHPEETYKDAEEMVETVFIEEDEEEEDWDEDGDEESEF